MLIALLLALACGVERQSVKVLADPAAKGLHRKKPSPTTIEAIRAIRAPPRWSGRLARLPVERRLVVVEGWIQGYKLEADNDLHVVLADKEGRTIVTEYPADGCTARSYAPGLQAQARAALLAVLPPRVSSSYRILAVPLHVRITGPVFLDKVHGQTGVAPNGGEVHPVIRFEEIP